LSNAQYRICDDEAVDTGNRKDAASEGNAGTIDVVKYGT
jgi:hypothetical protein